MFSTLIVRRLQNGGPLIVLSPRSLREGERNLERLSRSLPSVDEHIRARLFSRTLNRQVLELVGHRRATAWGRPGEVVDLLLIIDSQRVIDGSNDILRRNGPRRWSFTVNIGLSDNLACIDGTREQRKARVRPVIAPTQRDFRRAAKFAPHQDQHFLVQSPFVKIGDQRVDRTIKQWQCTFQTVPDIDASDLLNHIPVMVPQPHP